jgi:hypothetical protein
VVLSVATRFTADESGNLPPENVAIILSMFSSAKTMIARGRRNDFN